MDSGTLKLAAEKLVQLNNENKDHQKRAHALRLIYKQAEMGYGDVPRSYSELQEKIASLVNQDLNVLEKALELTGGNIKLGELDTQDVRLGGGKAEDVFKASILGDY
jgi:hypothetical protein